MYIEIIDDFLSEEELSLVDNELSNIKWIKKFNRAGSHMLENNDIANLKVMQQLYFKYSQPDFLSQLSSKFNVEGILPDPYMIGAGYSEIKDYGDLKPHIDFNWNDSIKLYRIGSLIIYLSGDYEGGDLVFEDYKTIQTKRNRAVIFEHSENIRHMVEPVKGTRHNIRFFYYASKLNPPIDYHRSLYGLDNGKPSDI